MDENKEQQSKNKYLQYTAAGFLATSLAIYGLMRKGNYRAALSFYPKTGGGGLNVHERLANGQLQRRFAIDYHPFWDRDSKQYEWKLHYHRGESAHQMRKHRPYEGGW